MTAALVPPVILTSSGRRFDLLSPSGDALDIECIAHSLSHICRFSGHTRHFYSVAQHSVMVSLILPDHLAMAGLMHDAAEAFIGDMVTPLKRMLPNYRELEFRIETCILNHFGVSNPLPPEVKHADLRLLATEKRDLMPHDPVPWEILKDILPLDESLSPAPPSNAKRMFLDRFHEIMADVPRERLASC